MANCSIRLLQTNSNRCWNAMDLLHATAMQWEIDVVIACEHNNRYCKKEWTEDESGWVAIRTYGSRAPAVRAGRGKGFVWLEMRDYLICGAYFSPNAETEELENLLKEITHITREKKKPFIVAGDLNAKSPLWGSDGENKRGSIVAEWLMEENLIVGNSGNVPTFERGGSSSVIDTTFMSPELSGRMKGWKVHDELENLSDHHYITYTIIPRNTGKAPIDAQKGQHMRWKVNQTSLENIKDALRVCNVEDSSTSPRRWTKRVQNIMDQFCPRKRACGRRKAVHWWNEEIGMLRRECLVYRRRLTRSRRNGLSSDNNAESAAEIYKQTKHNLKRAINRAKKNKWSELLLSAENDPWGNAYKIVMGKLHRNIANLDRTERCDIAKALFPTAPDIIWEKSKVRIEDTELFTDDEILTAAERIKAGKAPGPDGIPPEVVKVIIQTCTKEVRTLMNNMFRRGVFPEVWKKALLVLIPKAKKKTEESTTYRPICLLDVMGKVYERLILSRLEDDVEKGEGLSDNQYGFRKRRSTTDAVMRVKQLAYEGEKDRCWKSRQFSAIIAVDIQNAFNSAPWPGIIAALEKKGVRPHMINVIKSYLNNRTLEVNPGEDMAIKCGVPQGSILGPTLWNVFYDQILRLDIPHTSLVGYADDLVAVIKAPDRQKIEMRGNQALDMILDAAKEMDIQIATQKTEAVLTRGRRKIRSATFKAANAEVRTVQSMKYLGVHLNRNLTMGQHVEEATQKANSAIRKLMSLMPNCKGPNQKTRKILASSVYSVLLYASPAWEEAIQRECHRRKLERTQRRINIRVAQAYRTVSSAALCVIAGYPPAEIMVRTRSRIYREGKENLDRIEEEAMTSWQKMWMEETKGEWTRTLIQDVRKWVGRKHGETEYYLTQFLTGHGCFRQYLHRFCIIDDENCQICRVEDSPSHVILDCPRWSRLRKEAEMSLGQTLRTSNIIPLMLRGADEWSQIHRFIKMVLSRKEEEERERPRQEHRSQADNGPKV